jgi:hypothetical protein
MEAKNQKIEYSEQRILVRSTLQPEIIMTGE